MTSDQAIDKNSQFAILSITKTFTAIGIMQLVEDKSIRLEDRAIDYLPAYDFLGEITIRPVAEGDLPSALNLSRA